MDVLSTFPVCMKIAPVYYWQIVYPEFYAVFLGFCWLGLRITSFGFSISCASAIGRYPTPIFFALFIISVSISAIFSWLRLLCRDDANNVLGVRLSYLLRSVPGRESSFFCSTGIHVSGLLFHLHIISMILRVAPQ